MRSSRVIGSISAVFSSPVFDPHERGLISRTAAGYRAYQSYKYQESLSPLNSSTLKRRQRKEISYFDAHPVVVDRVVQATDTSVLVAIRLIVNTRFFFFCCFLDHTSAAFSASLAKKQRGSSGAHNRRSTAGNTAKRIYLFIQHTVFCRHYSDVSGKFIFIPLFRCVGKTLFSQLGEQ